MRDRFLEEVNERGLLPEAWNSTGGKYDVSRQIGFTADRRFAVAKNAEVAEEIRLLDAA